MLKRLHELQKQKDTEKSFERPFASVGKNSPRNSPRWKLEEPKSTSNIAELVTLITGQKPSKSGEDGDNQQGKDDNPPAKKQKTDPAIITANGGITEDIMTQRDSNLMKPPGLLSPSKREVSGIPSIHISIT